MRLCVEPPSAIPAAIWAKQAAAHHAPQLRAPPNLVPWIEFGGTQFSSDTAPTMPNYQSVLRRAQRAARIADPPLRKLNGCGIRAGFA